MLKFISCSNCCHFVKDAIECGFNKGKKAPLCELTHKILLVDLSSSCEYFNKDVSNEHICFNCEHYLGGSDWGLSCARQYNCIVDGVSSACDLFKRNNSR